MSSRFSMAIGFGSSMLDGFAGGGVAGASAPCAGVDVSSRCFVQKDILPH
jgi:hypothetical protein